MRLPSCGSSPDPVGAHNALQTSIMMISSEDVIASKPQVLIMYIMLATAS